MKKWCSLITGIFLTLSVFGQEIAQSGTVRNAETGEFLPGATVQVVTKDQEVVVQTSTNNQGDFHYVVPAKGEYTLTVGFVGFKNYKSQLDLSRQTINIELIPFAVNMDEVIISSLFAPQTAKEAVYPVGIQTPKERLEGAYATPSEIAAQIPGVALAKDGAWGTSITIRGLNEQRIVTLINGNRIETANDLYAGLSMLHPSSIQQVEVIKGASSALHGSGAMGGIINMVTHTGDFSPTPQVKATIESSYDNVNKAFGNHARITAEGKNWYLHTGIGLRQADDVRTPEGTLENSQYTDQQINISTGIKKDQHQFHVNYQNYQANDVGIPGGSPLPGPAKATYTNADRELMDLTYKYIPKQGNLKTLEASYFYQSIVRDVELFPNVPPTVTPTQIITPKRFTPSGSHYTQGAKLTSTWAWNKQLETVAGVDTWQRRLETSREKEISIDVLDSENNIIKTNQLIRAEEPIPQSRFMSSGIFAEQKLHSQNKKATFALGARLDNIVVENDNHYDPVYLEMNGVRNDTPPNQRLVFEEATHSDISWSVNASALYRITPEMHIAYNIARAYRSPSLEERFKYIDLGTKVRLGNPNLEPEQSFFNDLSLRMWYPKWQLTASAYINSLSNLIVETPGAFIYTYTAGGTELTDTLPSLTNNNVNDARYYGIDLQGRVKLTSNWHLSFAGAYVRGEDTQNDTDLPLVPPMRGRLALTYQHPSMGRLKATLTGVAGQDKVAEGESSTAGYGKTDLNYQSPDIPLKSIHLTLVAGIDNLFDKAYTNHLATNRGSISIEPGRNIYFKALFNL
ncbi:MAG: TonB-dependent receptor [Bacteroidales bacterium]